jgi:diguanylate cyclase (GGDEF)-like protein/PAS domain S-box-containing protein
MSRNEDLEKLFNQYSGNKRAFQDNFIAFDQAKRVQFNGMAYTPGLWLFILASVILGGIIVYSWRFRQTETGRAFLFLILCAFIWAFFFIFETAVTSLNGKIFFATIEFAGITFLPSAWVFLVLAYTGASSPHWHKPLILIIPALTNIVIWTNPLHHWFMGNPHINQPPVPFPVLAPDYQFWFYAVHAPASYIFLLIAIIMLVCSMFKMGEIYRTQTNLLLLAILMPSIADILYILGITPIKNYNYTTAVFSLSGLLLLWTLFRFRFLDLLPLARDTVIDNLNDAIVMIDHKSRVVYANNAAQKFFDVSASAVGKTLSETHNEFLLRVDGLLQKNLSEMDIEIGSPDSRYFDLRISPVINKRGLRIGSVTASHDITERTRLFNQVQSISVQDSLTGIFNRRRFTEVLQQELLRIQRNPDISSSLAIIDLDNFKQINDTYGHSVGDQVLIAFTNSIKARLRKYDVFSRFGGDEFALLLIDVTREETLTILERLRVSVQNLRVPCSGHEIGITASFGIINTTQISPASLEMEIILQLADQALYQAKQAGRNCVR